MTTSRTPELLRAIAYPVTNAAVLVPMLVLWLLLSFALWGGLLGLFLLFLVVPAALRLPMVLLEARARGAEPAVPDIEFFNWFGNAWMLFYVPVVLVLGWAVTVAGQQFGAPGSIALLVVCSLFLPAFLGVLAVTRSPLQSLNPVALLRLTVTCRRSLWLAAVAVLVAGWLGLQAVALPLPLAVLVQLLLLFTCASLLGSVLEPYGLTEDVYIPDALEKSASEVAADVDREREQVLNHAYGIVSRGNRDNGLRHVRSAIEADADPVGAWAWYFDRMLRWERPEPALFFAQHYVHDLLRHGDDVPAVKLILRCRLIDERFRPAADDLPAAIRAAEQSGNMELAAVLNSG